jgi:hypothetical protein
MVVATIVDLQVVAQERWKKPSPHLASVLAIAEGGCGGAGALRTR